MTTNGPSTNGPTITIMVQESIRRATAAGHAVNPLAQCTLCGDDLEIHEWITVDKTKIVECDRQDGVAFGGC